MILIAGRCVVLVLVVAAVGVIAFVIGDRLGCDTGTFAYTVPIEEPVGQEDWRQDVGILIDGEERIIFNDHRAVDVDLSSDGERLVFVRGRGTLSDENVGIDPDGIFVQDIDGSDTELIAKPGGFDPDWSPDGGSIVYRVGGRSIWTVDLETGEEAEIFRLPPSEDVDPEYLFGPAWSPDSQRIAFFRGDQSNDVTDIWVTEADGSDPHLLVRAEDAYGDLAWSPDGERLAWTGQNGSTVSVFIAEVDGGRPEAVEPNAQNPVWSRDGTQLAYVIGDEGRYADRIVVGDSDGSNAEAIEIDEGALGGGSIDDWVSC